VKLAVRKGLEKSAKMIRRPSNNPKQFANMSKPQRPSNIYMHT